MNHFSFFDTYMLCVLPVFDAHICLRSWPFRMFWYSLFMRLAEYYDIERDNWDEIVDKAACAKKNQRYLVIFPEGHRSRTGQLRRFYSGAFKLAVQLDMPVFSLCVSGTQRLLPPSRWWLRPAWIQLQLLPPIFPGAFSGDSAHIEMRKYTHRQMAEVVNRMERAAHAD